MNVIPPLAITDARLTSSTVVETAPAIYAGGTTYALNDTASVAVADGLLTVYRSLQSGNLGHAPTSSPDWWISIGQTCQTYSAAVTYALGERAQDNTAHRIYESLVTGNIGQALTDATKWLEIGPTNKWAMFDLLRNTRSIVPSSLTAVLTAGVRIDSIALLNMVADNVTVTMTESAVEVYSYTANLSLREVFDWYDYFFAPFTKQDSLALFDLPPYSGGVITVALAATIGNVELGACVIGSFEHIGDVEYSAESDVLNFSSVTRDFAGGTSAMVQRRNVPKTNQRLALAKSRVDAVRALRDALNAQPAVWSGLDDSGDGYFEALLILGFYKQFSINLALTEQAIINLELEEI